MTALLVGAGLGIMIAPGALLLIGFLMVRSWLR